MAKKTLLQSFVLLAIEGEPTGTMIRLPELYRRVKSLLTLGPPSDAAANLIALCCELQKCADRGDLPTEPRWKNDIRWAIRHASRAGMLKHVGTPKSGEWLRV